MLPAALSRLNNCWKNQFHSSYYMNWSLVLLDSRNKVKLQFCRINSILEKWFCCMHRFQGILSDVATFSTKSAFICSYLETNVVSCERSELNPCASAFWALLVKCNSIPDLFYTFLYLKAAFHRNRPWEGTESGFVDELLWNRHTLKSC